MSKLKPLSREAIPAALAKAERYRLLGEPVEAESICLDVLDADSTNQDALVMLVLAITDQFAGDLRNVQRATTAWTKLTDSYERAYYGGIICERKAKAQLNHGTLGATRAAVAALKEALNCYTRAEPLRPAGNDDVILRWNACVRLLERHPDVAPEEDGRHLLMLE